MGSIAEVVAFLATHTDLITAIYDAIAGGASKQDILAAVKKTMVAASDEQMKQELG